MNGGARKILGSLPTRSQPPTHTQTGTLRARWHPAGALDVTGSRKKPARSCVCIYTSAASSEAGSAASTGVEDFQNSVEPDLQYQGVDQQDHRALRSVHLLDAEPLQNFATNQAAIRPAELVVHEPLEGVRVESQMIPPQPPIRDVLLGHHEPFTEHEHPKHSRPQGHPDNVVRLRRPDDMHQGLCHQQRQEQAKEEVSEAVKVCETDHKGCRDQGDQRDAGQAGQEIGCHVREGSDVAVGPLTPEHITLLEEERKHRNRHEDQESLHVEQARQQGLRRSPRLLQIP
mmetsp:Transcript_23177/g.49617  ORF Transcript_23177/g.49617 Transcript_23177/m.49617 type:complete len:287 (-) Transcript_23177:1165-2025(-)